MKPKMKLIPLLAGLVIILGGCSNIKKVAISGAVPVVNNVDEMTQRMPLKMVKKNLPSTLHLVEDMLRSSPDNYDLLVIAAKGFAGYAIMVEDDDPEHATKLYRKAREYGFRALKQHPGFREALDNGTPLWEAVKLVDDKHYIEALLWTGLAWGMDIMLNIDDPMVVVSITDVRAIMEQVMALDDAYFYGMPRVFFGSYYAILPSIFGGGTEAVVAEFDKAFEISEGKFLLAHVFYARYYATLIKDEELFFSELNLVLDTPSNVLPEVRFLNELAQAKAKRLIEEKDKLFF